MDDSTGAVASTVNKVTESALDALPATSVTIIVQSEYVPSDNDVNVIVLDPNVAEVVPELHEPPYEIVPASSVVNI